MKTYAMYKKEKKQHVTIRIQWLIYFESFYNLSSLLKMFCLARKNLSSQTVIKSSKVVFIFFLSTLIIFDLLLSIVQPFIYIQYSVFIMLILFMCGWVLYKRGYTAISIWPSCLMEETAYALLYDSFILCTSSDLFEGQIILKWWIRYIITIVIILDCVGSAKMFYSS